MQKLPKSLFVFAGALLLLGVIASLTSTGAIAQLRATIVRSVDEPARIPYEHVATPNRTVTNVYQIVFPAVPAGRRLKLTRITGLIRQVDSANLGAFLSINDPITNQPRIAFPLNHFVMAYYGRVYSFDIETDLIYEAGQSPRLEMGVSALTGGLPLPSVDGWQTVRAHGYLIDLSY